jgi:hypothetical protein
MSFAGITIFVAFQGVFIVVIVVYFVIDSVRKLLDITSYCNSFTYLGCKISYEEEEDIT